MSYYQKSVGIRNVGSYQVSGTPYVTGSGTNGIAAEKIQMQQFPLVSKSVTVINKGAVDLYVHFASGTLSNNAFTTSGLKGQKTYASTTDVFTGFHYITVPNGDGAITFDVKCSKIFITNPHGSTAGTYEIFAELTQIPTGSMFKLTGSGVTAAQ